MQMSYYTCTQNLSDSPDIQICFYFQKSQIMICEITLISSFSTSDLLQHFFKEPFFNHTINPSTDV